MLFRSLEPLIDKWKSFGFHVNEVNGHDTNKIYKILKKIEKIKNKPKLIICHTIKGKGIAFAENNPYWHHKNNLKKKDIEELYRAIG